MKKWILLLVCPGFLAGCLPAVDGKNYYLSESAKVKTAQTCEKLRSLGQYRKLREKINEDVATVKELLKQDNTEEVQDRVRALGQRIRDNSDRLITITESPYIQVNVAQRLRWALGPEELGLAKKGQPRLWNITHVEFASAYNWQGENEELLEFAQLQFDSQNIQVRFQRPATALELCQLQQSLVIVLKVDFRGPLGRTKTMHYKLLAQNVRKQ